MVHGLAWSAASNALVAVVFLAVGLRFLSRRARGDDAAALRAFASWWVLYAAQSAVTSLRVLFVAGGVVDAGLHEAMWMVENALSVFAVWGLAAYLSYLFRGDRDRWAAWAVGLGALALFYAAVVAYHDVTAVFARTWSTGRVYARPPSVAELAVLAGIYYGLLVGHAVAFGRLARRVTDRRVRVRALANLWALVVLSVVGFLSIVAPADSPLGPFAGVLRVLAAVAVAAVYFPRRRGREPPTPR